MHKALPSMPSTLRCTWEVEAGGSEVQSYPQLHSELVAELPETQSQTNEQKIGAGTKGKELIGQSFLQLLVQSLLSIWNLSERSPRTLDSVAF